MRCFNTVETSILTRFLVYATAVIRVAVGRLCAASGHDVSILNPARRIVNMKQRIGSATVINMVVNDV
jgi:hypothetical protein